jgi:hypothetical protein
MFGAGHAYHILTLYIVLVWLLFSKLKLVSGDGFPARSRCAREASLTEAKKAALVRRFSGQVTRLVYSLESGSDIIINAPLTPDIVDAVNSKKSKAFRVLPGSR